MHFVQVKKYVGLSYWDTNHPPHQSQSHFKMAAVFTI